MAAPRKVPRTADAYALESDSARRAGRFADAVLYRALAMLTGGEIAVPVLDRVMRRANKLDAPDPRVVRSALHRFADDPTLPEAIRTTARLCLDGDDKP